MYITCSRCEETKCDTEFHKHSTAKSGKQSQCKDCRNTINREYISSEDIKEKYKLYRNTEAVKAKIKEATKQYRRNNKEKFAATSALNSAVSRGDVEKDLCAICGTDVAIEAHHADYMKPLDVLWLCSQHHSDLHRGVLNDYN